MLYFLKGHATICLLSMLLKHNVSYFTKANVLVLMQCSSTSKTVIYKACVIIIYLILCILVLIVK